MEIKTSWLMGVSGTMFLIASIGSAYQWGTLGKDIAIVIGFAIMITSTVLLNRRIESLLIYSSEFSKNIEDLARAKRLSEEMEDKENGELMMVIYNQIKSGIPYNTIAASLLDQNVSTEKIEKAKKGLIDSGLLEEKKGVNKRENDNKSNNKQKKNK